MEMDIENANYVQHFYYSASYLHTFHSFRALDESMVIKKHVGLLEYFEVFYMYFAILECHFKWFHIF